MENDSQIKRGFEELTKRLVSIFNPPLIDPSQKPLMDCLDKAFESLRAISIKGEFGKVIELPDEEMINIIQGALVWYKNITSVDEALGFIEYSLNQKISKDIKRVAKNKWIIENLDALKELSELLTERHRTLKFQK